MGRIKELLDKLKSGDISDAEKLELKELQEEAQAIESDGSEEEAIEEVADKIANATESKLEKSISKLVDALNKSEKESVIQTTKSPRIIIDKKYGEKSVEELDEIKVELPGRKSMGKNTTEVSQKTMHFIDAWLSGNKEKLQVLVEGTGARGGFLVPDDFANVLVEDIRDATVIRQAGATQITTQTDTVHIPTIASRPKAEFRSEAATKTTSTVDFSEVVLTPYSLASIVPISNELVADASLGVGGSIVNAVAQMISTAIGEREDRAFAVGSGTGQPTGIDTYTIPAIVAGLTDSERADALIQTFYRLGQGYRNKATWILNSRTLEKVRTYKDGNNNYLVSDLGTGAVPTLYGRPVFEQNDLPDGKAFLGDFSYYWIADREGLTVKVSDEATVGGTSGFESNITFVRVEKRVDGELTLTNAFREVTGLGGA